MAQTYALIFAAPLLITILAIPILGETVGWHRQARRRRRAGRRDRGAAPRGDRPAAGHIAALTAAVFSAIAAVVVRKIGHEERSAVLLLYPMVANFLIMGCALPFVYREMPAVDLGGLMLMACLGFLGGALPHLRLPRRQRRGGRTDAVLADPLGRALRIGVLRRAPDWSTAIGAAIIILSGIYVVLREDRGGSSKSRPVLETRSRFVTGTYPRISSVFRLFRKSP